MTEKLTTLDPYKSGLKELYTVRFTDTGSYIGYNGEPIPERLADEYTSFQHNINFYELVRLEEDGKVPAGEGGFDLDSIPVWNLFHQDDIPPGQLAYVVVCTYTDIEYTFGSMIDQKRIVAVCETEADANVWLGKITKAKEQGRLWGVNTEDSSFSALALPVK